MNQLKLLGDDGLPLYDLCRYRDVWVKVTGWMVYLQQATISGVRPDYSVFAQQHSAAVGASIAASSSSAAENEARGRYLREGLPMYSNLRHFVAECSADTSCEVSCTREVVNRDSAASRPKGSTSHDTRL